MKVWYYNQSHYPLKYDSFKVQSAHLGRGWI